ncbi:hypothetical protein A3Q56_07349 [Intoshia linei]|uniref:Ig-like domain-containing protein n=1 Tax=Intoshia linei TaxID=1819745 RepID=A0A177ASE8_9BILA|nr:hypothetical protein A3Q56_07349 [Intoshia linei]
MNTVCILWVITAFLSAIKGYAKPCSVLTDNIDLNSNLYQFSQYITLNTLICKNTKFTNNSLKYLGFENITSIFIIKSKNVNITQFAQTFPKATTINLIDSSLRENKYYGIRSTFNNEIVLDCQLFIKYKSIRLISVHFDVFNCNLSQNNFKSFAEIYLKNNFLNKMYLVNIGIENLHVSNNQIGIFSSWSPGHYQNGHIHIKYGEFIQSLFLESNFLKNVTGLTELICHDNNLKNFTLNLSKLQKLTFADLSFNEISNFKFTGSIFTKTKLKLALVINLGNNLIKNLDFLSMFYSKSLNQPLVYLNMAVNKSSTQFLPAHLPIKLSNTKNLINASYHEMNIILTDNIIQPSCSDNYINERLEELGYLKIVYDDFFIVGSKKLQNSCTNIRIPRKKLVHVRCMSDLKNDDSLIISNHSKYIKKSFTVKEFSPFMKQKPFLTILKSMQIQPYQMMWILPYIGNQSNIVVTTEKNGIFTIPSMGNKNNGNYTCIYYNQFNSNFYISTINVKIDYAFYLNYLELVSYAIGATCCVIAFMLAVLIEVFRRVMRICRVRIEFEKIIKPFYFDLSNLNKTKLETIKQFKNKHKKLLYTGSNRIKKIFGVHKQMTSSLLNLISHITEAYHQNSEQLRTRYQNIYQSTVTRMGNLSAHVELENIRKQIERLRTSYCNQYYNVCNLFRSLGDKIYSSGDREIIFTDFAEKCGLLNNQSYLIETLDENGNCYVSLNRHFYHKRCHSHNFCNDNKSSTIPKWNSMVNLNYNEPKHL